MSSPVLLRWTRFTGNPFGTGAEKRTAQIRSICEAAGFAVDDMQPPRSYPRWRTWAAGLPWRVRLGAHASVDRAGTGLLGHRTLFYREALARHDGARLLLWETTYDTVLPLLARSAGYGVIALPHNLESFVTDAAFADPAHDVQADLVAEVERLRLADAVFTIAAEERRLLEKQGLRPDYLPYYPDPVLADECTRIRQARTARGDGGSPGPLLLLGSAFNPATAHGMRLQLEWLRAGDPPPSGVMVAGFKTDAMLADAVRPGVRLLGGVSREVLAELMEKCSALLIHTFGGAGAVTRIPEALLAGIPVIANENAARDAQDLPGVHIYRDQSGFQSLVRSRLAMPPPPPRPVDAENCFQKELRRLCGIDHA